MPSRWQRWPADDHFTYFHIQEPLNRNRPVGVDPADPPAHVTRPRTHENPPDS
jgi:hypothetical protein